MRVQKPLSAFSVILILVLLAACDLPSSGGTGSTGGSGGGTVSGPCGNPLLPVVAGATWNYQMTGSVPASFTRTITEVNGGSFTDQDIFDSGVTRTEKWNCEAGNLIALDPVGSTSASVETSNLTSNFQTSALTGVTLPASVTASDSWSQAISMTGTMITSGVSADSTSDTNINCTAIGTESVTVPAGTFDAMKVSCQDSLTISVTTFGVTITPITLNFTTDSWYAPGIGWIQSLTSGEGMNSTIVLVSYSIP
jgi:hypothetical protein